MMSGNGGFDSVLGEIRGIHPDFRQHPVPHAAEDEAEGGRDR
jgi:hypothetical protein